MLNFCTSASPLLRKAAFILTVGLLICPPPLNGQQPEPPRRGEGRDFGLSAAISNAIGATNAALETGVSVVDLETSQSLVALSDRRPLEPASVLKIVTTLVALHELGPQYRFTTELFIDGLKSGRVKHLYIRGGGDPGLTTETALLIAREVRKRGISNVGSVVLDTSRLLDPDEAKGQRAYETGSAAIAFNHNALQFTVCPTAPGRVARITVDPFELSAKLAGRVLTSEGRGSSAVVDVVDIDSLSFALGGKIGTLADCDVMFRAINNPEKIFSRIFEKQLEFSGVRVENGAEKGFVPDNALLFYEHRSQPLKRIVEDLNHYSSNFIAQQILSALGENASGQMSRSTGLARLKGYLLQLGFDGEFRLEDASGLSHGNRLSARIVTSLLSQAHRDISVGPEFLTSLSVAEESGTLRKRSFGLKDSVVRAKTGTLDGVSSLAGYVYNRNGKKYAFAILQNGVKLKEEALKLENRIAALIAVHR